MFSSRTSSLCFLVFFSCILLQECKGDVVKGYDPPEFCSPKIDCPKYDVIHSEKEFEIRNYTQALWATAPPAVQSSIMGGIVKAENNLTDYFYKRNDQGVNIISQGPVVFMEVFNSTYKVYLYVPYKYQNGGIPKPLSPEIELVKLPTYKYAAVRRHRGEDFGDDSKILAQVDELKKNLKGTPFQKATSRDRFTYALYDQFQYGPMYEVIIWFD